MIDGLTDAGGAERFALGLVTSLPPERFETWMCTPRGAGEEAARALSQAGVPLVTLGRRAKWDIHRLRGLLQLMWRERFDIVHAHKFGSNLWGTLAGRACRVPVVIAHEQTWSYEGDRLRAWLDGRVIGRLATRFVAVSASDADQMVRTEKVPPAKVVLIPNAYVPHQRIAGGDLRTELGLAPDAPLVGAAAVMRPQKALDVLVDAHARVVKAVPDAHLVIAGDGECRQDLERRVRQSGLAASVHFLGMRNDVDSILTSIDVAAMSSDFEGTPLFAFECMASGTPLVATAVGGLPDIIENDRTGVLVPRRDPEELAKAIASLLVDPDRRARLATAAAQHLREFTIEAIAERFADLYESLANDAGCRA